MKINNHTFDEFARLISLPAEPHDYSPAAMKRLMVAIDRYVVDVKNVPFKFRARNRIELIRFASDAERQIYDRALERWEEAKVKEGAGYSINMLVELMIFQKAAEFCRTPHLAKRMYQMVQKGKSAVCAVKYKDTISKVVSILVQDYGVKRDDISLIWGGMAAKAKPKRPANVSPERLAKLQELFSDDDLEFLAEMGLDKPEALLDVPQAGAEILALKVTSELRLGTQSKTQRQYEIDRFQEDKSKYCLFTFKSGGVGLSLHQQDPEKRVRESVVAPTYSAIELVQALGRPHRITSESETVQTMLFYADTIEVAVAARVSQKLKCLRQVVRQRDSWEDVIMGGLSEEEEREFLGKDGVIMEDSSDESQMIADHQESPDEEGEGNV